MLIGSQVLRDKVLANINKNIIINNTPVQFSQCEKNLGLLIDNNLSFQNHIKQKCSACYPILRNLYNFKSSLPSSIKWRLVESLILSILDYGSAVYFSYLTE